MRILLSTVALFLMLAAPAAAQTNPVNRIELEVEVYEVPRPKPLVMVVITRQNLDEDYDLQLRESFLPRIVRSVDAGPF